VKKGKKSQTFCTDCRVRLADSIFPPALSRRPRVRYPGGQMSPKKYVCHECGVMQAWGFFA